MIFEPMSWARGSGLLQVSCVMSSRCMIVTIPSIALSSPHAQVLKDVTQCFSHATPNLATIIPAMGYINNCLSAHTNDCSLSSTIKASLGLGKKTLNWYYSLTDSSEVYHIAMGVYSGLCFSYVGSNNFLGQSFTLVTSYCASSLPGGNKCGLTPLKNWYVMNLNVLMNRRSLVMTVMHLQKFMNCFNIVCLANWLQILLLSKLWNVFDNLPSLRALPKNEHHNKLAWYLSTDPEAMDDVLMWWHKHSAMYPTSHRWH